METEGSEIGFRSIAPSIPDAGTFANKIGKYLINSETFTKRCPPWERREWCLRDLRQFKIEIPNIDRVYYHRGFMVHYSLFVRMKYKDRFLYIHLSFNADWFNSSPVADDGKIYLTFDAQVFLKAVIHDHPKAKEICKMMNEDGLQVEEASLFDIYEQWNGHHHGVPTLTFLCELVIYENRNRDRPYEFTNILPYLVAKHLQQFMQVRETLEDLGKVYDPEENEYKLY